MAVVALVAVLFGAVGTALAQAGFLGRRVTRELARAVCVVSSGDCWRDREPCVVGSSEARSSWEVGIWILRFGEDRVALVERRSDGTYAVTLEGAWKGGIAASGGPPHGHVQLKGIDFSAGGAVTASLLARLGDGRTWIVASAAAAQAIVASGGDAGRPPDVVYDDRAWLSSLSASLGAAAGDGTDLGQLADAQVAFDQHWGTATDRRTGHRTTSIHASWSGAASALGRDFSGGDEGPVIAIEADAAGRPLDLRITTAGRFTGSRDLPGVAQPVAGLLAAEVAGADRRYEVTTHLDLTDPRALAAAGDLVTAIDAKHARTTPGPELRRLVDAHGTVEARVLSDQATSDDDGVGGGVAGVQLSFDEHAESHDRRLLAAASRGLDGQWITRTDCVAA
ncbi:MAG TPA: hypothetical protein VI318_01135 [Baekduia sp.]